MNASFIKRTGAYLFDLTLFAMVLIIFFVVIPRPDVSGLESEMDLLSQKLIQNEMTFESYIYQVSELCQEMDKKTVLSNVINLIYVLIYFVTIPVIFGGKTLGKHLFKIRIVKDSGKLNFFDMLIRTVINQGLLYMIFGVVAIYLLPSYYYFIVMAFLSIIQILLVIISIFMILYRRDKCGIQDLLSKTHVIDESKNAV